MAEWRAKGRGRGKEWSYWGRRRREDDQPERGRRQGGDGYQKERWNRLHEMMATSSIFSGSSCAIPIFRRVLLHYTFPLVEAVIAFTSSVTRTLCLPISGSICAPMAPIPARSGNRMRHGEGQTETTMSTVRISLPACLRSVHSGKDAADEVCISK